MPSQEKRMKQRQSFKPSRRGKGRQSTQSEKKAFEAGALVIKDQPP